MPNISRSKANQTMKFGQLIWETLTGETFFLKNHTQNVVIKLFAHCFLKSKLSISLNQHIKNFIVCFYCMQSWGLSKDIETKHQTTSFTSYKAFKNQKEVWNESPCLIFCITFEEKYLSYILLIHHISFPDCIWFVRYWAIYVL